MSDVRKYTQQIQDLIDEFPDDDYIELLEEMSDLAMAAKEAREEELGGE